MKKVLVIVLLMVCLFISACSTSNSAGNRNSSSIEGTMGPEASEPSESYQTDMGNNFESGSPSTFDQDTSMASDSEKVENKLKETLPAAEDSLGTTQLSTESGTSTPPTQQAHSNPSLPTAPSKTEPTQSLPVTSPSTQPSRTEESTTSKVYTQADYNRIIAEVKAYAQSYSSKGFTFRWKDSLVFGDEVGYMGTPRMNRDGYDGVIRTLKYHVDLIYKTGTDPTCGVTSNSVDYKIVQITIDGGVAFAVIYGG